MSDHRRVIQQKQKASKETTCGGHNRTPWVHEAKRRQAWIAGPGGLPRRDSPGLFGDHPEMLDMDIGTMGFVVIRGGAMA